MRPTPPEPPPQSRNVWRGLMRRLRPGSSLTTPLGNALADTPVRPRLPVPDVYSEDDWQNPLVSKLEAQVINPQEISQLCGRVPFEIRHEIWTLALLPYQDTTAPMLPFDSYGYRPSTRYPTVQAVALLRACRLVYLECHDLPASLRTFLSWRCVGSDRIPHGRSANPEFCRLTRAEFRRVQHFHIYAGQCYLEPENWLRSALISARFRAPELIGRHIRTLTVTIRHTDFWNWEVDSPLKMDGNTSYGEDWRRGLDVLPNLEELTLDLETLERRAHEMDALVKDVKTWEITLHDKRILSSSGIPIQTYTWIGSSRFCGGQRLLAETTTLAYYVVTITWKAPKPSALS